MRRYVFLLGLCVSLVVSASASASAVQPVSPADGAVFTQNPPSTFRWSLDPSQQSCGATITAPSPQSPWQNAHDVNVTPGWTMSLNGDGVSATIDNQDPLVWGLYHWTVYSAAADFSDGGCNDDGTGPNSASGSFTYGPQLDVSALDNYTAATQLRVLSVFYPTLTMTGAQALPGTSSVSLAPAPYAPAIKRGYVTVPWTCTGGGIQDVLFTAADGARSDIQVGQPCDQRFSFHFSPQPLVEGHTFAASFDDAWSSNPPPSSPKIPVRYRFCASGPRLRRCVKDSYDLTRYSGVRFHFKHARLGRYTFRLYIGAQRVATTTVAVRPPPLPVLRAGSYSGIRPSAVYFSGDGGNIVTGIHWSRWTRSSAMGAGTSDILGCVPSCAQGSATPVATTIALSRPRNGRFTVIVERRAGQTYTGWPGGAA